jgi:hypothetical protein
MHSVSPVMVRIENHIKNPMTGTNFQVKNFILNFLIHIFFRSILFFNLKILGYVK